MKRATLARAILPPVIALVVLSVVGVGFLALTRAERLFGSNASDALLAETRIAAENMGHWLSDRRTDVDAWAHMGPVTAAVASEDAAERANAELRGLAGHYRFCQAISVLDPAGDTRASSDPNRLGKNFASRDYFKRAMAGEHVLSEVLISGVTGKPFFTVAVPLGEVDRSGVVYAPIQMDAFTRLLLDPLAADSGAEAILFHRATDTILASRDSALVLRARVDTLPWASLLRSLGTDSVGVGKRGDRPVRLAMASVPGTPWVLALVRDMDSEARETSRTRWMILGASFLASLLVSILIWFVLRPVLANLRRAVDVAESVSRGEVAPASIVASSGDEIGELMSALGRMSDALREQAEIATRVAGRDLSAQARSRSEGDILGNALSRMVANLRELVGRIRETSRRGAVAVRELDGTTVALVGASQETATGAATVMSASDQVHRNVQSVAGAAEEMGASIREIARSAAEAASFASKAGERAREADRIVARLGEASGEIGSVIETIRGIADQTNLLALNATIEAARAGEAGRGFAVVAGEVKELSKATAGATEDIRSRVEIIQKDMHMAVDSIHQIATEALQIGEINHSIASAVEEQAAAVSEITRSLADASIRVGEIAKGVQGVQDASRTVADGAEAIRGGTRSLDVSVEELDRLVGQFRLE